MKLKPDRLFSSGTMHKVKEGSIGVFGNETEEISFKLEHLKDCQFFKERLIMIDKEYQFRPFVTENNECFKYFYLLKEYKNDKV